MIWSDKCPTCIWRARIYGYYKKDFESRADYGVFLCVIAILLIISMRQLFSQLRRTPCKREHVSSWWVQTISWANKGELVSILVSRVPCSQPCRLKSMSHCLWSVYGSWKETWSEHCCRCVAYLWCTASKLLTGLKTHGNPSCRCLLCLLVASTACWVSAVALVGVPTGWRWETYHLVVGGCHFGSDVVTSKYLSLSIEVSWANHPSNIDTWNTWVCTALISQQNNEPKR